MLSFSYFLSLSFFLRYSRIVNNSSGLTRVDLRADRKCRPGYRIAVTADIRSRFSAATTRHVNEARPGEREWGTRAVCMRLKRPRSALTRSDTIMRARAIASHDVHRGAITLVVEKLLTAVERDAVDSLNVERSRAGAAASFRRLCKKNWSTIFCL